MKQTKIIILFLIIFTALFLRSYHLDTYPPLNPDEAAIGYNAYSLLQTGQDEHGASWPIHFKSFGDFKPGGYFYLVLPFIKVLGLNTLAVRIPNLILSVVSIYFVYLLVKLLSKSQGLALISSFILAINPWHIHFSRGGWESTTALSFVIIGSYFFYKYIQTSRTWQFLLFVLLFCASIYTYHSARIYAPLFGLFYLLSNFRFLLSKLPKIYLSFILAILILIPVFLSFTQNGGTSRFNGVGIFADSGPYWRSNELLGQHPYQYVYRIIHNKVILYGFSWMEKYFSHFNGNFLFINGDEVPRSKVPEMGQFYLVDLFLLLAGIFILFNNRSLPFSFKKFILFWILISPLASSLTFQSPSALRSLPLVLPLTIIISLGLKTILNFHLRFFKYLFIFILSIIYSYSLLAYLDSYYFHYQQRYPQSWGQGFDQVVSYINSQKDVYPQIYVTDKYDQPYILYLFYSVYQPSKIQSQIHLTPPDRFGFSTVRQIDNIHFETINWSNIPDNSLIIAADEDNVHIPSKTIYFSNGQPAFKIYSK